MKGINLANTIEASYVNDKYIRPRNKQKPEKNDDCFSRECVRAGSWVAVCRPAAVSSWPPHRLSPIRPLLCTCFRSFARAFVPAPFQSVPLPSRPEKQNAPRTCGSDLKITNILAHGEYNPSLPHSSTLRRPPPSSNPASYRRNRLCRNVSTATNLSPTRLTGKI